eukprot:scaffold102792_cov25-Tisochrysis_lutea.AAC.1
MQPRTTTHWSLTNARTHKYQTNTTTTSYYVRLASANIADATSADHQSSSNPTPRLLSSLVESSFTAN